MDHNVRVQVVGGAAVVALGIVASLVTSTIVASRAYVSRGREQARGQQEITVKGSARVRVRSDLAVWVLTVRGEADELPRAYERLEAGVERVSAFLSAREFPAEAVSLSAIDTTTHHVRDKDGHETRRVEGFTLERSFTVRSADVDRFATAAAEATALLKDGVPIVSGAPAYYFTKAGEVKTQIVGDASQDARARADQVAGRTGCRVTGVRQAHVGPIQIVAPDSVETSGGGSYDTATPSKDVWVVVTVTFGIEA